MVISCRVYIQRSSVVERLSYFDGLSFVERLEAIECMLLEKFVLFGVSLIGGSIAI